MVKRILKIGICTFENINKYIVHNRSLKHSLGLDIEIYSNPDRLFRKILKESAFDVVEFSFSNYIYAKEFLNLQYTALPIFPSRKFRHSDIYIRNDSNISSPKELEGKVILSYPSFFTTAAIWQRGILKEDYGLDLSAVQWFASKPERFQVRYAKGIKVTVNPNFGLSSLKRGQVDCILGPLKADGIWDGSVKRLFPNAIEEELNYYERTGIFPIMHTIIVKDSIISESPEIVEDIYYLFENSKNKWLADLKKPYSYLGNIPFYDQLIDIFFKEFGSELFSYGYKQNKKSILKLIEYCQDQIEFPHEVNIDNLFLKI